MANKILLFGATSAIARETARCFAREGDALFLVARNSDRLSVVAEEIRQLGADQVHTLVMDALAAATRG